VSHPWTLSVLAPPSVTKTALLAAVGPGTGSPLAMVQLRQLGGALGRRAPGAGARAALPHRAGFYPNFVEEPADASAFFDPDTWRRLREVKATYDPDDLFKGNHHIPPADELAAQAVS
jgi:hypothetical protein